MTGEVTLTGRVLPIGGVKEKVLAAHRRGLGRVFLPEDNRRDLEEVPEEAVEGSQFLFASTVSDALPLLFPDGSFPPSSL
jgi:ATP-dependent Lon protease